MSLVSDPYSYLLLDDVTAEQLSMERTEEIEVRLSKNLQVITVLVSELLKTHSKSNELITINGKLEETLERIKVIHMTNKEMPEKKRELLSKKVCEVRSTLTKLDNLLTSNTYYSCIGYSILMAHDFLPHDEKTAKILTPLFGAYRIAHEMHGRLSLHEGEV